MSLSRPAARPSAPLHSSFTAPSPSPAASPSPTASSLPSPSLLFAATHMLAPFPYRRPQYASGADGAAAAHDEGDAATATAAALSLPSSAAPVRPKLVDYDEASWAPSCHIRTLIDDDAASHMRHREPHQASESSSVTASWAPSRHIRKLAVATRPCSFWLTRGSHRTLAAKVCRRLLASP